MLRADARVFSQAQWCYFDITYTTSGKERAEGGVLLLAGLPGGAPEVLVCSAALRSTTKARNRDAARTAYRLRPELDRGWFRWCTLILAERLLWNASWRARGRLERARFLRGITSGTRHSDSGNTSGIRMRKLLHGRVLAGCWSMITAHCVLWFARGARGSARARHPRYARRGTSKMWAARRRRALVPQSLSRAPFEVWNKRRERRGDGKNSERRRIDPRGGQVLRERHLNVLM